MKIKFRIEDKLIFVCIWCQLQFLESKSKLAKADTLAKNIRIGQENCNRCTSTMYLSFRFIGLLSVYVELFLHSI